MGLGINYHNYFILLHLVFVTGKLYTAMTVYINLYLHLGKHNGYR